MSHICVKPGRIYSTTNPMEDFINSFFGQNQTRQNYSHFPVYRVEEQEKDYQLLIELPGYEAEAIEVRTEKDTIVVEHTNPAEENKSTQHREFTRRFTIPKDVEQDKISAHYKNGLLTISLPKKEEAAPMKIKIN